MLLRQNVCNHMIVSDGINKITYQVYLLSCVWSLSLCIATMIAGRTQTDVQTLMEEGWLCLDHMTGECD